MAELKRAISLTLLTFYGLGTILGAGIYVLVGKVAGFAGMATPSAFLLAAIVALFTGLSYSELAARLPKSGGEAVYVLKAYQRKWLAGIVGWVVIFSGVVSAATLANGFTGYLDVFISLPHDLVIILLVIALGFLSLWGIVESLWAAMTFTLMEVFGLLLVLWYTRDAVALIPKYGLELLPSWDITSWTGVVWGSFLAFYAFIGFEDMVNIAEEVKEPRKNIPRGILISLVVATLFYLVIASVAVLSLPLEELIESAAPLADLVEGRGGPMVKMTLGVIGLFAVLNGALVQMIMASRVAYGMACYGLAYNKLGHVSENTQTPVTSTIFVTMIVLIFALALPIVTLAKLTSYALLFVFAMVNGALVMLKLRDVEGTIRIVPLWVPLFGLLTCLGLIAVEFYRLLIS